MAANSQAVSLNDAANALFNTQRIDDAIELYRQALRLDPRLGVAHYNLGNCMQAKGLWEAAIEEYEQALQLTPDYAAAHNNLANVLHRLRRHQEATVHYEAALRLDPNYPEAWYGLGNVALYVGQVQEAEACYRECLARKPGFASAHFNLSLALLLAGDYAAGWPEYEWRWQCADGIGLITRQFASPPWDGTPAPGATLLVHAEQGFGDTLQFVRYLRLARPRVGKLILQCQPELHRLLRTFPEADEVVAEDAKPPRAGFHAPLLSLPHLTGTPLLPATVPYLQADPALAAAWQARLAGPALKVGLAWAGRPLNARDYQRSMALSLFAPLLGLRGVRWFALQKGEAEAQIEQLPNESAITNLAPQLEDFADTAAAVSQLDLVVTVDSAVAHLAGALGRPVWTLLPKVPNWRWGLTGDATPWYSTMRLFRQRTEGDWPGVIDDLARELEELSAGRGG